MEKYDHSSKRRSAYFEGWYFKHQTKAGRALALIPAVHVDGGGKRSASLQVLADGESWWLEYPVSEFHVAKERFRVEIGDSLFAREGLRLCVEQERLSVRGTLRYGPFLPLRSDIMGPFRIFGGMECAHGVISMGHVLQGSLTVNGETLDFSDGVGYVETDRGRSFPSAYLWTQCTWPGTSLMLAVAKIPFMAGSFTGSICAILHGGREFRLATYRGARVEQWSSAGAVIRQGKYCLIVEVLKEQNRLLRAPVEGGMSRTIRESLCAKLRFRFWEGETLLFDHIDSGASFEYADRRQDPNQT